MGRRSDGLSFQQDGYNPSCWEHYLAVTVAAPAFVSGRQGVAETILSGCGPGTFPRITLPR